MKSVVTYNQATPTQNAGERVTRKVLAHLPEEMVVEVTFEQGAIGAPHRHPHTQCTYVHAGEFRFTIDGQDYDVAQGDTLAFAPNELHGCVCLKAGVLIDVFTPMREDFL